MFHRGMSRGALKRAARIEKRELKRLSRPHSRCPMCLKGFPTHAALLSHELKHLDFVPYDCDQCGQRHSSEDALMCTMCPRKFSTLKSLEHHTAKQHTVNKVLCSNCGNGFESESTLRIHLSLCRVMTAAQQTGVLRCLKCGLEFPEQSQLVDHIFVVHLHGEDFTCCRCGNKFYSEQTLRGHDCSAKLLVCMTCCKWRFVNDHQRQVHEKEHVGEPPKKLTCYRCLQTFAFAHDLSQHKIDAHPSQFQYDCQFCYFIFASKKDFTRHEQNDHKYVVCKLCNLYFKGRNELWDHQMKVHGQTLTKEDDKGWEGSQGVSVDPQMFPPLQHRGQDYRTEHQSYQPDVPSQKFGLQRSLGNEHNFEQSCQPQVTRQKLDFQRSVGNERNFEQSGQPEGPRQKFGFQRSVGNERNFEQSGQPDIKIGDRSRESEHNFEQSYQPDIPSQKLSFQRSVRVGNERNFEKSYQPEVGTFGFQRSVRSEHLAQREPQFHSSYPSGSFSNDRYCQSSSTGSSFLSSHQKSFLNLQSGIWKHEESHHPQTGWGQGPSNAAPGSLGREHHLGAPGEPRASHKRPFVQTEEVQSKRSFSQFYHKD